MSISLGLTPVPAVPAGFVPVVELRLADDGAGAVAGLAQIQELFETDQLALRVRPDSAKICAKGASCPVRLC